MGVTVRQKSSGKGKPWWIFVHANGQIRSKKIGDRKAAESVASELRKRLKAGELQLSQEPATLPRFSDYADDYLNRYAKTALKFTTWKGYETIIKIHLLPVWRHKRLDQIKRADVKRLLLAKQQDGLARGTVENIKALVSGIFTQAYEDELLPVNPALRLGKYLRKDDRRRHIRPFTRDQSAEFLHVARDRYPDHYPLFLTAFRTGMRMGELLGLKWEDVDFETCTIEIRRSYSHGHWSTPKSHKSRTVDMSDQLRAVLAAHRQRATGELLFPNAEGKPLCGDNFRKRVFKRALEAAGVPKIRFHDIRHTFASLLLAQGESIYYVKEQMGHASITTTVDVYGHMVPGANREAVNKLDDPPLKVVTEAG